MKRSLLFLLALVLSLCASVTTAKPAPFRACGGSGTNLTAPTWADVALCHTAASGVGETITVASGSYTVTTNTAITKYVKIVCGGTCTLTDNVADVDDLITITESTAGHTRFEGFDIIQGTGEHINPNGVIRMVTASMGLGILITGNSYASLTSGDFIIAQVNRGVIWNNSITATWINTPGVRCSNNVAFVRHKLVGVGGVWTEGPYYGTADTNGDKNLYVEANLLDNAFEGYDADANARGVVRYNTFINSGIVGHGADTGSESHRYIDIDSNTFVWDTTAVCGSAPASVNSFIYLRGAPALIHGNVIPDVTGMDWGDKSEVSMTDERLRRNAGPFACWDEGYPAPYQVGWGYSAGGTQAGTTGIFQDLEPVYLWSNTGAGNYAAPAVVNYPVDECSGGPDVSTFIQVNREYYLATAKPGYTAFAYPHPDTLLTSSTYYVTKSGSDDASCLQAKAELTAKLTIAAGLACVTAAGDTLSVKAGTYYERLRPTVSGTSGNPVTITGERGENDEYLTIIDGSDLITGWVTAPEVGTGVYKTTKPTWVGPYTSLTNDPCHMTANGESVWHISWAWADGGFTSEYGLTALQFLALSGSDSRWDGVEALFANQGSNTYVRFADNSNPNSKTMRVSPWSWHCVEAPNDPDFGAFFLNGTDYNTIKNFDIAGGSSVVIVGAAIGNIVEDNSLHDSSYYQVYVAGGTSNTVRNNTIYANAIGEAVSLPGSWSPGGVGSVKENIYNVNKYLVGTLLSSATMGVAITGATGTIVDGNTMTNYPVGVYAFTDVVGFTVSGNTISNCGSLALYWELIDGNVEVSDNLVIDCNGNFRGNRMQLLTGSTSIYIYGNRTYQSVSQIGYGMYFSMANIGDSTNAHIYIYNNTHIGGFSANSFGLASGQSFPNLLAINNFVQMSTSADVPYDDSTFTGTLCSNPNGIEQWDYNWTFGAEPGCVWDGPNNIESGTKTFDDSVVPPDWALPAGHVARNAGIDITESFTVNGVMYSALPGYVGVDLNGNPHIGAVQDGPIAPPSPNVRTSRATETFAGAAADLTAPDWAQIGIGITVRRDGNGQASASGATSDGALARQISATFDDKQYAELEIVSIATADDFLGVGCFTSADGDGYFAEIVNYGGQLLTFTTEYTNGLFSAELGPTDTNTTWAAGDKIGIECDGDAGHIWVMKNEVVIKDIFDSTYTSGRPGIVLSKNALGDNGDFGDLNVMAGTCVITLSRPLTGSVTFRPATTDVVWSTSNCSGNVTISFSSNNGSTYLPTVATVPYNQGTYIWDSVITESTQVKARVCSGSDCGTSGAFTVHSRFPMFGLGVRLRVR